MKKNYKLHSILMMIFAFAMIVKAQTWNQPAYKGEIPVSGTTYYIYNVGSNAFLNRGGEWAAEAVVTSKPIQNAGTNINKWTCVESGGVWTFQYNNNGTNANNHFLFQIADGAGWIFTDNSTNNTWAITETDAINHIFAIQVDNSKSYYNASQFLGAQALSRTSNRGICNSVRYNEVAGANTQWKFISQANYDLYQAKVLLHRYMTYAKAVGGHDLTAYIATYNADVTADINTAAANLLTALGRTDVTSSIVNPAFDSGLTGWTNTGGFVTNNWTTPIGFTRTGNLVEKWIGGPANLSSGSLLQTVTGLSNGIYQLEFDAQAVQQSGSNPLNTGAFLKAGASSTQVNAGGRYIADYAIVNNGTLVIGYSLEGTVATNWTAIENFQLYYYGPTAVPSMSVSKNTVYFTNAISTSTTFEISGANLTENIIISAPAGINLTGTNLVNNGGGNYTILNANANVVNQITLAWDEAANLTGTISIVSTGVTTQQIAITTSKDNQCFSPLFNDRTNIVSDPYVSSLSNFGGWGSKSLVTDPLLVYCGSSCASVGDGAGAKGSVDVGLVGKIAANKTYRVKAMVKTIGGEYQLGVWGWSEGQADINNIIDTNGSWQELVFNFTTGATLKSGDHGLFWNNWGRTGTIGYIDNWEMYDIDDIVSGLNTAISDKIRITGNTNQIVAEVNSIGQGQAELMVYNLQGVRLHSDKQNITDGFNKFTVNKAFSSGIYLIKLQLNGEVYTTKIVI